MRPRNKIEGSKLRRGKSREEWDGKVQKEERRRNAKGKTLESMGYVFEMPGLKGVDGVPRKEGIVLDAAGGAEAEGPEEVVEVATVTEKGEGEQEIAKEKKTSKKRAAEGKPKVKEAKKAVKKVKT